VGITEEIPWKTQQKKLYVCAAVAKMPPSCRGRYGRVALVLSDNGSEPLRIADSKNCTVIESWERLNIGKTSQCAFARAKRAARKMAEEYTAEHGCEWVCRLKTDVEFKH